MQDPRTWHGIGFVLRIPRVLRTYLLRTHLPVGTNLWKLVTELEVIWQSLGRIEVITADVLTGNSVETNKPLGSNQGEKLNIDNADPLSDTITVKLKRIRIDITYF